MCCVPKEAGVRAVRSQGFPQSPLGPTVPDWSPGLEQDEIVGEEQARRGIPPPSVKRETGEAQPALAT